MNRKTEIEITDKAKLCLMILRIIKSDTEDT